MKKFFSIVILLLIVACQSGPQEFAWSKDSYTDVLHKAGDKLVLVQFYTDWWSWCKRLDADTFPDKRVIDLTKKYYLALKVNAEENDGPDLKVQYNIQGFPTTVFINADGEEVDRIVGYLPPDKFAAELDRIRQNIGTIAALEEKVKTEPNNIDLWMTLAEKYESKGDIRSALDVWNTLSELDETISELSSFKIAKYSTELSGTIDQVEEFIQQYPESKYVGKAYYSIVKFQKKNKNAAEEAKVYKIYTDLVIKNGEKNYNALNGYAWRMAELELNLKDALEKVRLAVEMIDEKEHQARAQVMDTEAEVLWKLGQIDEAVKVIDACIKLQPDDEYYSKQKKKFLNSGS